MSDIDRADVLIRFVDLLPNKLQWVTASTARRMLVPHIDYISVDIWDADLFTVHFFLNKFYPDTFFFLVDNEDAECVETF